MEVARGKYHLRLSYLLWSGRFLSFSMATQRGVAHRRMGFSQPQKQIQELFDDIIYQLRATTGNARSLCDETDGQVISGTDMRVSPHCLTNKHPNYHVNVQDVYPLANMICWKIYDLLRSFSHIHMYIYIHIHLYIQICNTYRYVIHVDM